MLLLTSRAPRVVPLSSMERPPFWPFGKKPWQVCGPHTTTQTEVLTEPVGGALDFVQDLQPGIAGDRLEKALMLHREERKTCRSRMQVPPGGFGKHTLRQV